MRFYGLLIQPGGLAVELIVTKGLLMLSRIGKNIFTEWWWTIDRALLFGVLCLLILGVVISFAASPPIAERLGLPTFFFTVRHGIFAVLGGLIIISLSFSNSFLARRLALMLLLISLGLMVLVFFSGEEIKGARRWIRLAGISIQPSELLKPSLVVIAAWFFAESIRYRSIPGVLLGVLIATPAVIMLFKQPDIGQMVIICLAFAVILVLAGLNLRWLVVIVFAFAALAIYAYSTVDHVRLRIDRFLGSDNSYQVERALDAVGSGGWYGRGPGEGQVKYYLPDAHADYVFPVVVEEFGIIAALSLLGLIGFVSLRGLYRARCCPHPFEQLASAGLMTLFSLQALVNLGVSLDLLPPKGTTLPFISFGGSSLLSMSITMGLVLALTRKRPVVDYSRKRHTISWRQLQGVR